MTAPSDDRADRIHDAPSPKADAARAPEGGSTAAKTAAAKTTATKSAAAKAAAARTAAAKTAAVKSAAAKSATTKTTKTATPKTATSSTGKTAAAKTASTKAAASAKTTAATKTTAARTQAAKTAAAKAASAKAATVKAATKAAAADVKAAKAAEAKTAEEKAVDAKASEGEEASTTRPAPKVRKAPARTANRRPQVRAAEPAAHPETVTAVRSAQVESLPDIESADASNGLPAHEAGQPSGDVEQSSTADEPGAASESAVSAVSPDDETRPTAAESTSAHDEVVPTVPADVSLAEDAAVAEDVSLAEEAAVAVPAEDAAVALSAEVVAVADLPDAVRIRGLVKTFGDQRAVNGIDLTVPAGSFYGIVGPNGAGKTTTLSIVAGLLRADEGSVLICGIDQAAQPLAAKRVMGVLPDRLRTFDRLTGRQLLYYYGLLRGLAADVIEKRTADLARAFDLHDALSRVVSDYSAGMTKKIMLAGAMIHSPRVLVLDEPFEAVDPVSSGVILDILRAYVSHGGTVILSSHGMDLVERVCSRVAIIVAGEALAEGTIDEVRAGQTLEARFVELSGGIGEVEGLEWLHTFSD